MRLSMVLVVTATVLSVAACGGPVATSTPTPTATPGVAQVMPTPTPTPTTPVATQITASPTAMTEATPSPTLEATPTPTPTPTVASMATPEAPVAFFLEVVEPEDESVVRQKSVNVVGRSTPDAVVSINDVTTEVDAQGNFAVTVSLKDGPNAIEVIASDFEGNQESVVLVVVYVP